MNAMTSTAPPPGGVAAVVCWLMLVAAASSPAVAGECALEPQGEGRVAAIIDARSFRLLRGAGQHRRRDVDAQHLAARRDAFGELERRITAAAPDVENARPRVRSEDMFAHERNDDPVRTFDV